MACWLASLTFILCAALSVRGAIAADTVRVGALKLGTVNWELDSIVANGFDRDNGVVVEVTYFAGEDASAIAFRAGQVDVIVSDWLDVARLRAEGEDVTFAPYSSSTGAIMVAAGSPIRSLADLRGRKLGITGGAFDKGWLLLQGLAAQQGFDLARDNEIAYGAPPLIAESLRTGRLDAALNYWHFNARLEADGFRRIIGANDAARALGASGAVTSLGYVFHEAWADAHPDAIGGFLKASRQAKIRLRDSNAEWERLHAAGVVKDEGKARETLRDRYRDGIPSRPVAEEVADALLLFDVLALLGGEKLVGRATTLPKGTYWHGLKDER